MTKILALDTATDSCSVAINVDGEIREDFVVAPQDHTRRLLPMVDHLLVENGLALRDIDAIAFTHGPGSFTGLRICVGIVQGLAFGANLPVIGVSTLEIMAMSAQRLLGLAAGTSVLPVLDARMGEVYWALYRLGASGSRPDCLMPDQVTPPADVLAHCQQNDFQLVGGGCSVLDQEQIKAFGVSCIPESYPHAHDLARISPDLLADGQTQSALDASPVYIRNEVSWQKRRRIRS